MALTPKDWENTPSTDTPISAEALEDIEQRLGDYADNESLAATGLLDKVSNTTRSSSGMGYVNHGVTAGTARPTGWAAVTWLGSVEPTNAANGDIWVDTT